MQFSTRRRRLTMALAGAAALAMATVGLTTVAEAATAPGVLAAPGRPTGLSAIRLTGTSVGLATKSDPGGGGGKTVWAGARSSSYGISPFPDACGFGKAISSLGAQFPGSAPTSIWIVGNLSSNGVALQFPKPAGGGSYPNIS